MSLINNTSKLQELKEKIDALEKPENLTPALVQQDNLILQITTALQGKAIEDDSNNILLQNKAVTPTTATQTITADSGYDGLDTVTVNAMPTATQATPNISVNSSGLITASATQSAGYVISGTKSATKQLTTKGATTITPTDSEQVAVSAGTYVTGDIKVGASSGGETAIDTGSVTITVTGSVTSLLGCDIIYTTLEDGVITPKHDTVGGLTATITLTNVILNTSIAFFARRSSTSYTFTPSNTGLVNKEYYTSIGLFHILAYSLTGNDASNSIKFNVTGDSVSV